MNEMYTGRAYMDPGRALDIELASMDREDMEDEIIENRECLRIYVRYFSAVENMLKAKADNEPLILKSWIDELSIPEVKSDFTEYEASIIRDDLKPSLVNLAKALGYTREDLNAFYRELQ